MFIAVYEFKIREGMEQQFRGAWLQVTKAIYKHCGSYGSRLHTTENKNILVGYAQWPDKHQWQKNHNITDVEYIEGRKIMKECLVTSETRYEMQVSDDYLQSSLYTVEHSGL